MKSIFSKSIIILLCLSVYSPNSYALEVETHKAINKYIAQNTLNSFSLDSYLKNNLGLTNGKDEEFMSDKTRKVFEWLELGGEYEDTPPSLLSNYLLHRYTNHFHNPVAPTLESAGFSGIWDTGFFSGESAILWSQKLIGTQNTGGNYSWNDVREYYRLALTSENKDVRSAYFAETFRGIGQLMHLVEDMSVPEHARNDGHYLPAYEAWVEDSRNSTDLQRKSIFDTALANANQTVYSISDLSQPSTFTNAYIPIANLFDTNQYDRSNPNVTLNANIGLSEYTNANFLTSDTMFTSNFPYPDWQSVVEYPGINSFTGKKSTYLKKLGKDEFDGEKIGNGEHIDHLAVGRWGYKYLPTWLKQNGIILKMDDQVYADYASKLIPRAVVYSAGLLNYFFRGQIDMVPDPNSSGNFIIENYGNEAINANDGVFTLYYDGTDDLRHQINWSFPSDGRISVPAADANGPGKSTSVSFYAPTDVKVPGKYILVYKGTYNGPHF